MTNFMSDNCSGIHPDILAAIAAANTDLLVPSYGNDDLTHATENLFRTVFKKKVGVVFATTGTASNCLALALHTPPYGAIFCHRHAHIHSDEYGAPGLFTGGAQIIPVDGANGKIDPDHLEKEIQVARKKLTHPSLLSITQATEMGTVYTLAEIKALTRIAKKYNLTVHMDGARFAHAMARLGGSPADITWKAGVDVLTLSATKCGAFAAEAIVLFSPTPQQIDTLKLMRKKSGQTLSKMRFVSAQFSAWFKNDLWRLLAAEANGHADYLAQQIGEKTRLKPLYPVDSNQIFLPLGDALAATLRKKNHHFYDWHDGSHRLVTNYNTTRTDLDQFVRALVQAVSRTPSAAKKL